jgi:hypothetical protein
MISSVKVLINQIKNNVKYLYFNNQLITEINMKTLKLLILLSNKSKNETYIYKDNN